MRRALFGFLLVVLSGCASTVLEGYVGKPVVEAELDFGPPINIIELSDQRRAYQWEVDSSGLIPIGVETPILVPYSQTCIYTLTTTRTEQNWIVDGFREPSFECL